MANDEKDGDDDDSHDDEEEEEEDENTFSLLRFEDEVAEIRSYCVSPIEAGWVSPLFGVTSITPTEHCVALMMMMMMAALNVTILEQVNATQCTYCLYFQCSFVKRPKHSKPDI